MTTYSYKGHTFSSDRELSEEEWNQTLSYLDSLPVSKPPRKTSVLEDVGVGLTDLGHTGKTALDMLAGGTARLLGDEEGSDKIYDSMVSRQKAREEEKKQLDQGFGGKLVSGLTGVVPMLAAAPFTGGATAAGAMATMQGLSSASENIQKGASTGEALGQFGSEVATDTIANALPIGRGLQKGILYGAGGNVGSQAAQDLTGSMIAGDNKELADKYHAGFDKQTAEKYALTGTIGAVTGGVFGRLNKDGAYDTRLSREETADESKPTTPQDINSQQVTSIKAKIESIDRQINSWEKEKYKYVRSDGTMTEKQYEEFMRISKKQEDLTAEKADYEAKIKDYEELLPKLKDYGDSSKQLELSLETKMDALADEHSLSGGGFVNLSKVGEIARLTVELNKTKAVKGRTISEMSANASKVVDLEDRINVLRQQVTPMKAPDILVDPRSLENEPRPIVKDKPIAEQVTEKPVELAQAVKEAQSSEPFDPDITKWRKAEELLADPELKDIATSWLGDKFNKFERAFAGRGQFVEAIRRSAPVVDEMGKRIQAAIFNETRAKRTLWSGDDSTNTTGKAIMSLTKAEKKDSMAKVVTSMSPKDMVDISRFLLDNHRKIQDHVKSMDGSTLTPKQKEYVVVIAKFLDGVQAQMKYKEYRLGYLPSMREGDFAAIIKSGLGDMVHLETFKSKQQMENWVARASKEGFRAESIDLKGEQGASILESFDLMRDLFESDSYILKELKEKQLIMASGKGEHNKYKEGYSGFLGNRMFTSDLKNAKDMFKGFEHYMNKVLATQRNQSIRGETVKLLENPELKKAVPNQVETARYLSEMATNDTQKYGWATQVDKIREGIDNLWVKAVQTKPGTFIGKKIVGKEFDSKLYYPDIPVLDHALGMASQLFYIKALTSRPAFWAGQLLSSPFAMRQFLKEGTVLETIVSQGKAWGSIMSGGDLDFKHFVKQFAEWTDSLHPQFKNEFNTILDAKTNNNLTKVGLMITGQTPAGMADTISRYFTMAAAYHFYKEKGMKGNQLLRNVQSTVDATMVMYSRTNTSPFLNKMGLVGTQMAPLQKYGIAQMENLIGDIRFIAEGEGGIGKIKNMAPAISTLMTTMIMAGAIGLPLLAEYEAMRVALVASGKFLGWDDVDQYFPSLIEYMMKNKELGEQVFAKDMLTHGVVSAATGFDVGSSLRFNPIAPGIDERTPPHPLNMFPVIKHSLDLAAIGMLGIKNTLGGDVTEAESRKAVMGLQLVVGQNAAMDRLRFGAGEREFVPGGARSYGQVPQTTKEEISTLIGSSTLEKAKAGMTDRFMMKSNEKTLERRQLAVDLLRDGLRTNNQKKIDRAIELAEKAEMTGEMLSKALETGMRNENSSSIMRKMTNNKGQVSSEKEQRMARKYLEFQEE